MCSFLLTTKDVENLPQINRLLQLRGPDSTNIKNINGITFLHNLLSITGAWTSQPLLEDDVVVLFNGEIYNFDGFDNDTKCLIPLYKEYGEQFTKLLDGEFALALVDFNKRILLISTDTFKTKPLFFSINSQDIGIASYADPLYKLGFTDIKKCAANTTFVFDLKTKQLLRSFANFEFNLDQYKTDFDDWAIAFSESIKKRAKTNIREKIFIGLSSGYDSGAIACEMHKLKVPFQAYTHVGHENKKILAERYDVLKNTTRIDQYTVRPEDLDLAHQFIVRNTDSFVYTIRSDSSSYNEFNLKLVDDNGSNQFSYLCAKAKSVGLKIHISGAGADELFSDYGFGGKSKYPHSNFGGLFPKDLNTVFPWASFYGSSMESYLAKEEDVGGAYGIERRYPFLDKKVVQEFLWISQELKNRHYKSVLHHYLTINKFPFEVEEKIGF